ncbi:S1/P1 nuclease [Bradyrhizobium sp. HKCCYLS20291]|uniref:S1/P1 nuclease n=1 Tax=Bradyrhizobium sp. HKCCYLS20291 TaxID=3420766 RepID=UPI003EBC1D7B
MIRIAFCVAALLSIPGQAFAWGQEGHSIVAEVAQRRLSKEAAEAISKLLWPDPNNPLPAFSLPSLASSASWADDYRSGHAETGKWHYINSPVDTAINWPGDCGAGCVVSKLEDLKKEMRCETDPAKKIDNLRFAVHFLGDIHQPFHTVKEEEGANGVHLHMLIPGDICEGRTCLVAHEWQNLHEVWDSTLITKTTYAWGSYVDALEKGWLKNADVAKEAQGSPLDWANEAHAIAKEMWVAEGTTLDRSYYRKAKPKVEMQLGRAGLRLARYLNEIYASPSCPSN